MADLITASHETNGLRAAVVLLPGHWRHNPTIVTNPGAIGRRVAFALPLPQPRPRPERVGRKHVAAGPLRPFPVLLLEQQFKAPPSHPNMDGGARFLKSPPMRSLHGRVTSGCERQPSSGRRRANRSDGRGVATRAWRAAVRGAWRSPNDARRSGNGRRIAPSDGCGACAAPAMAVHSGAARTGSTEGNRSAVQVPREASDGDDPQLVD